jgi:mannosyltransferase
MSMIAPEIGRTVATGRSVAFSADGAAPSARAAWVWVAALTAIGAGLRIWGLNSELWWDEIYTVVETIRPSFVRIFTYFPGDNQHPLYSLLAHGSIGLFGEHPWSARLPAALFGVASIPALYLLASLVTTRMEGILASAFLTVSYHHVWFSQNARGYSALAFWAILSTYLVLRALREGRTGLFVGYAAVAALGIYTHLTMVFLVAAHALACAGYQMAGRGRATWRQLAAGAGSGVVFTLVLYAPILSGVLDFFLHRPSGLRGVSTPSWALAEMLRVLRTGFGTNVVLLVGGVVFGLGIWSYLRQNVLVTVLFLLPGVVTLLGALAARGTMYPRFFFYLAGFATLIVIRGAVELGARAVRPFARENARVPSVAGTVLAACVVAASTVALPINYRLPKQGFVQAMRFVEAERQPDEQVATLGVAAYPYTRYYGRRWPEVHRTDELEALRESGRSLLLIYTFPRYLERDDPRLMDLLSQQCPVVRVFPGTVGGGDVVVCRLVGRTVDPARSSI